MKKTAVQTASYVEMLARSMQTAKPYYSCGPSKTAVGERSRNVFPAKPGVYAILRRVQMPDQGYVTRGVNTKTPLVLYVGKTTARRTIRQRLNDHFGGRKPNYQGSQFRKFLYQVVQDHAAVEKILWSGDTLVACVPIDETDEVIDAVERLAIQVLKPRFNIKER